MSPSTIFEIDHGLLVLGLVLFGVLSCSSYWILFQYFRCRRRALRDEACLLSLPLPPDNELPHVLVQLPTFNEGALIGRVAETVAGLDWPRDRLHVQLLDDSNDGNVVQSEKAAAELRERGIDAVVLHRSNRTGFKAGALADGLSRSDQLFVAIIDADYLLPRDFLRRCMPPLLHDPGLAFVQARCDYLNGRDNFVTYAEQRILDAHFAVEQAARYWAGQVLPFNGTCGIWRRAAIEQAGGWRGDTLTEDLDLSYRVQLLGWRAAFLTTVTVPGELPATFTSWRHQQFRWTKGFAEVSNKMLGPVWRSNLTLGQKLVSTVHLGAAILSPLSVFILIAAIVDLTLGIGLTRTTVAIAVFFLLAAGISQLVLMLVGQLVARQGSWASELIRLPAVIELQTFVGLANLAGAVQAYLGRGSAFVRTPKLGGFPTTAVAAEPESYASRTEP